MAECYSMHSIATECPRLWHEYLKQIDSNMSSTLNKNRVCMAPVQTRSQLDTRNLTGPISLNLIGQDLIVDAGCGYESAVCVLATLAVV